jgi:hypothetical protein
VFTCYVSGRGHTFIDRELYLPQSWTDDKARMAKAHVPQELINRANGGFATKPALALAMIERVIAGNVPFSFVAADTVYGVGDIEMALRRGGKGYVLGVKSNDTFYYWGSPNTVAARQKKSPTACRCPLGSVFRPAPERKASGCMIGPILSLPISPAANTTRRSTARSVSIRRRPQDDVFDADGGAASAGHLRCIGGGIKCAFHAPGQKFVNAFCGNFARTSQAKLPGATVLQVVS